MILFNQLSTSVIDLSIKLGTIHFHVLHFHLKYNLFFSDIDEVLLTIVKIIPTSVFILLNKEFGGIFCSII